MNVSSGYKHTGRPLTPLSTSDNGTRLAAIDRDEAEAEGGVGGAERIEENNEKDEPVTWRSLPHRSQLIILTLARLSEPLVQTSLQSYLFYQLKQEKADSGNIVVSCLGFGFAKTFWQAMIFRSMGGALNGNIGVMRTMVSEIVQEKKYQSRAFLLFPMCFNIGVIIGPILGGLLADPAGSYPRLFGDVTFLKRFPYAAPNIVSAIFLFSATLAVFFGLAETLGSIRHKEDLGTKCARKTREIFSRRRTIDSAHAYTAIVGDERASESLEDEIDVEMSPMTPVTPPTPGFPISRRKKAIPRWKHKLPFRRIFTYNVICTLIAHALLASHLGTFNSLWFVFLSTPVNDPAHPDPPNYHRRLPFHFTGGLGMPPRDVGLAMSILGVIGILMQLFIYPIINAKFGTVKSWRIFLFAFPLAYVLVPFLSIVPSKSPPPAEKDGIWVWFAVCSVLFIQVTGRTFALPATVILINNSCPHPSVLGTVHGIGQSLSSLARTVGPAVGGVLYGLGLKKGVVGAVFWGLSLVAGLNCVASNWVREGDGHEIVLEGDEEAEAEWLAAQREIGGVR